jgi:hypothetical protein
LGRLLKANTRKLSVIAAVAGTAVFCTVGPAYAATNAGSQYGPPPPPAGVPGGFTAVITSVTIGPAGGTIGPVTVDGASLVLTIPPGAFASPVQISVTAPDLAAITPPAGDTDVTGFGVQVGMGGAPFSGTFLKPITATVSSPRITATSMVVVWNGTAFVPDTAATEAPGTATVSFDTDPQFVVQAPVITIPKRVPSAVTPVTGEPFLGEGVLAGGLLVLGSGGLVFALRRRRNPA